MPTSETYEYDRSFRVKLVALCLDDSWIAKYGVLIRPEYFERDDEESFVREIIEYRRKYGHAPDRSDMLAILGPDSKKFVYHIYKGYESWDFDFTSDLAVSFAQEQAAKLAILDSVDDIQNGNIGAAIERMKLALSVGQRLDKLGIDPVADVNEWLYEYWGDKIRTGWVHVDNVLEGGLSSGELGIILAPQNRGKSMALINIGYGAISIGAGKNVLHLSHEMSSRQVAKRYAARISFRFPKPDDDLDKYAEKLVEAARKLITGKVRIIDGPMNVYTIKDTIDRLADDGFEVDELIDDYPDLLDPPRRLRDRRFELSETYSFLRNLGHEYDIPVWGASQSRRSSHSREIITMEDIAEDIGKTGIADVIISICQTKEEEDSDQCRLFMAKVRDGRKSYTLESKFYGAQQCIITTGFVSRKSKSDVEV